MDSFWHWILFYLECERAVNDLIFELFSHAAHFDKHLNVHFKWFLFACMNTNRRCFDPRAVIISTLPENLLGSNLILTDDVSVCLCVIFSLIHLCQFRSEFCWAKKIVSVYDENTWLIVRVIVIDWRENIKRDFLNKSHLLSISSLKTSIHTLVCKLNDVRIYHFLIKMCMKNGKIRWWSCSHLISTVSIFGQTPF